MTAHVKFAGKVAPEFKAFAKAAVAVGKAKAMVEPPAFGATKVWHEVAATVVAATYAWYFFAPATWHVAVKGFVMTAAVAAY